MTLSIRTNIVSLEAQSGLRTSSNAIAQSTERLSSGLRINHAKDDPAGIAVASKVEADAAVARVAVSNISQGLSYLNTARDAIKDLKSLLQNMEELAARATSNNNTQATRVALDDEFQTLVTEYNRIVGAVEYNYQDVFTAANTSITVQAGYGQNGRITASLNGTYNDVVGTMAFSAATTYYAGSDVSGILAADVNGDGIADILSNSVTEDKLFVQLGNGNGTFKAQTSFAPSAGTTNPIGLATGDFNGDGKLDVVSFASSNTAQIYIGNGDGSFYRGVAYSTSSSGGGFGTVGDFDNDGFDDIAIAQTGAVNVLLNSGSGTFGGAVSYASAPSIGAGTHDTKTFDFNGDGNLDLAVNGANNEMYISLGNGNGTFNAGVSYLGWSSPSLSRMAFGDLNNDGYLDVVQGTSLGGALTVMLGNADGSFKAMTTFSTNNFRDAALVDSNGDGNLDLIATGTSGTTIITKLGNGDGSFRASVNTVVAPSGTYNTVTDVNGDWVPDVVFGGTGGGTGPFVMTQGTTVTAYTKRVRTLSSMSIATQAGAYTSEHLTDLNNSYLESIDSSLSAGASRYSAAKSLNENQALILDDAYDKIVSVDVASEAYQLIRNQIAQQAATLAYQSANEQAELIGGLVTQKA